MFKGGLTLFLSNSKMFVLSFVFLYAYILPHFQLLILVILWTFYLNFNKHTIIFVNTLLKALIYKGVRNVHYNF